MAALQYRRRQTSYRFGFSLLCCLFSFVCCVFTGILQIVGIDVLVDLVLNGFGRSRLKSLVITNENAFMSWYRFVLRLLSC